MIQNQGFANYMSSLLRDRCLNWRFQIMQPVPQAGTSLRGTSTNSERQVTLV